MLLSRSKSLYFSQNMHFDTPLIAFSAKRQVEANIKIIEAHEENKELLPLDLTEVSESGMESWIRHRSIPKNRAYVDRCSPLWG